MAKRRLNEALKLKPYHSHLVLFLRSLAYDTQLSNALSNDIKQYCFFT